MSDSRLQELRSQVDVINLQILDLLNKRADLASAIGKVQAEMGTSFYDPQRESQMLTALEQNNKGPFSNETIKALFKEIFRASMALEEKEAKAKILVQRKTAEDRTIITLPDGVTKIGDGSF
ncbi:MAG: chorismate mutase, partial [Anaerolineae bacterium]|nr:chorismate mutase [Anaerolineae bacterium]